MAFILSNPYTYYRTAPSPSYKARQTVQRSSSAQRPASSPAAEAPSPGKTFSKLRQDRNYQPPRRQVLVQRQMSADALHHRTRHSPDTFPQDNREDPVTDCETYDDDEVIVMEELFYYSRYHF